MLSRSLNPCVDFRWLAFIVFTSVWWSTAAWPDDVLMMMAVFPVTLQCQTIISASHLLQLVCLFVSLSLSLSLSCVCVMCIDLYLDLCQHIDLVLHYSGQLGPQHANRHNATVLCLLSALVKLGRQMFKYPPASTLPSSSPRQSDKLPL